MKQKSKKFNEVIAALAMSAVLFPGQSAIAQSPARQSAPQTALQGVNLFTNPGHEHPGAYFDGRGELNVSWNWVPFWEEPPPGTDLRDQNYRTPEFRPTFGRDYPYRVNSGGGGDHWFNFYALNKAAGVMQIVEGLTPGQALRYTSWVSLWSSNDNDPAIPPSSSRDGNMQIRACVLQDGGPRNLVSKELVCSPWAQPYDKWYQISVDATAKNNKVLAFVQSRAAVTVQHNDAFVDDSCFEILPGPGSKGICLGQAYVPTGSSTGVKQQSKPIPPAPVATNEKQVGSAYVNLPGFPSSGSNPPGAVAPSTATAAPAQTASASPATASAATASGVVKANVTVLNIRKDPSVQSQIMGTLSEGEQLPALKQAGNWWSVQYNGNTAYVNAALVTYIAATTATPVATSVAATATPAPVATIAPPATATAAPAAANVTGVVGVVYSKGAKLILLSAPSLGASSSVVGEVANNINLAVTGKANDDFWTVRYNGATVYVNAEQVTFNADVSLVTASTLGNVTGAAPGVPAGPAPPATPVPITTPESVKTVFAPGGNTAATAGRVPQGVNIRAQPDTTAIIKQALQYGEVIEVTGRTEDGLWFEVKTDTGPGYVFASLTVPNEAAQNAQVIK